MLIAITNIKGGVGKTTTAVALATMASRDGLATSVLDCDPQSSATLWWKNSRTEGAPLPFDVRAGNLASFPDDFSGEWVFVDCPPSGRVCDAAVESADFVIVPTTPASCDMQQTWSTVEHLQKLGKMYAVLVCKASAPRTRSLRMTVDELNDREVSCFETIVPQREDVKNYFGHAFQKPMYGYENVWEELKGALDGD